VPTGSLAIHFPKNVTGRPKKAWSNHSSASLRFSNKRTTGSRMLKGRGIQLQREAVYEEMRSVPQ
jgi:hypothetical protein